ncbi:hypothetical protein CYY_004912 [Polysphondylium violaceum]|uniref:RRM domain-containing protein n=1 Tax=Polysphondylium violaceum TaxID=133409 RepID=A0A8J4PTV7_9MYCE|nr:hypothetical protein CYY_004912 [Polysphondylium violaceum]
MSISKEEVASTSNNGNGATKTNAESLDVDALLEESFNKGLESSTNTTTLATMNEKKRSSPEDAESVNESESYEKKRKSSERDGSSSSSSSVSKSNDRDRSDRDRDRDRSDRDRDRDYRDKDRDRDRSDRDRDRDYRSSDRDRDRYSSRDYRDRDRDRDYRDRDYYSSSRDRYSSRDYRDRDRDRDHYSSRDRYRDDKYDKKSDYDRKDKYKDEKDTREGSSSRSSSNRDSKEKSTPPQTPKDKESAATTPATGIPEPDEESDLRTVFVSNLSPRITEKDLYDFFAQAGKVLNVSLITDRITKRLKGVGYVEFAERDQVQRAISLAGQKVLEQSIQVHAIQPEKKQPKPSSGGNARIYVGYIHIDATEEMIRTLVAPYGDVDFINIHTKPGVSKYAFIQFKSSENAKRAIQELNGKELMGKNLKLNMVSEEKNSNGTYIQVPQINNIIHHNYQPVPIGIPPPGAPNNMYHNNPMMHHMMMKQQQQQQQQYLMRAQGQGGSILGDPSQLGLANNPYGANNSGINNNQHSFRENNALSSLDEDDGGIPLTAQGRALLTAKLLAPQNTTTTTTTSTNNNTKTTCVLLKNMFDPETETADDWEQEIQSETYSECSTFGKVQHIFLDKNSKGCIYLRFDTNEAVQRAIAKLNGRWFGQKQILADPIPESIYKQKFPY